MNSSVQERAKGGAGLAQTGGQSTLPALLLDRCERTPTAVAMREKRRGIYHEITWAEYRAHTEAISAGLRALGLRAGDRVAVLSDPRPEWLFAELGTLAAGGICYGIYPTSSPEQIVALLRQGGARCLIAEDQEQVDKVLPLLDALPDLEHVAVIDPRGMFAYDHPRLLLYEQLLAQGAGCLTALPALVADLDADRPAIIIYTSGTTGEPRGAVYSHRAIMCGALDYRDALFPPGDREWLTVCHLPLNHAFEQWNTVIVPLVAPVVPHFGEEAARVAETLFEVAPDFYASVPRYWQKMAAQVLVALDNTAWEKRHVYNLAMSIGRRYIEARWKGRPSVGLRLAYGVAHQLAFRPILDKLGLKRVSVAITAGGPIPPEVQTLWQIWGVNLRNLYGQTEAGFVSVQRADFPRPGDVGPPAASVRLQLAADGEIMVQSPGTCLGYWQAEAATAALKADGWVLTGDAGRLTADGALVLVDRKKDILITAGGKNVSPLGIEDRLRASPYISEAVVLGDGRKYLTALVEIDFETVSQWARTRGLAYGGFSDLAAAPDVYALIHGEVRRVNAALARVEEVKAFRILPRELDPEADGEPVTPTRKVKRVLLQERFRDLVEAMYDTAEEDLIATQLGEMQR